MMGISTSLIAAGGIAALSLFDIPELRAQPASRSLPSTRWLFSRGSHIFPTAAYICTGSFGYLAYIARYTPLVRGYMAAAIHNGGYDTDQLSIDRIEREAWRC